MWGVASDMNSQDLFAPLHKSSHRPVENYVIESFGIMLLFQKLLALCQICMHVPVRS